MTTPPPNGQEPMHVRSGVVWAGVVLGLALTAASAVDGELERAVAFSCTVAAGALFYLAYRTSGRRRTATLAATAVLGSVATLVFIVGAQEQQAQREADDARPSPSPTPSPTAASPSLPTPSLTAASPSLPTSSPTATTPSVSAGEKPITTMVRKDRVLYLYRGHLLVALRFGPYLRLTSPNVACEEFVRVGSTILLVDDKAGQWYEVTYREYVDASTLALQVRRGAGTPPAGRTKCNRTS